MNDNAQSLNTDAVNSYLAKHLPGYQGPLSASKFQLGQSNPTFKLTTPDRNYVLRRKPPGQLLKSAHAVDREFRIQSALQGTDVPVAKMHFLCQDETIIGSDFYVMDLINGRNFNEPTLDELNNADRSRVMNEINRVLAALHDVDLKAVGLEDYGAPGDYFERQVGRWVKQYRATETDTLACMDSLIEWLQANMPAYDGQRTLVHGDFRLDNMMFEKSGTKCLAVLDWELSTTGHPYSDLASIIMQWQLPVGSVTRGLAGVDRVATGLPSNEDFIEQYCARRGIAKIDNFGFYVAFCFFRMSAIIQGVYKRALDGNASDPEGGLKAGEHVSTYAELGLAATSA